LSPPRLLRHSQPPGAQPSGRGTLQWEGSHPCPPSTQGSSRPARQLPRAPRGDPPEWVRSWHLPCRQTTILPFCPARHGSFPKVAAGWSNLKFLVKFDQVAEGRLTTAPTTTSKKLPTKVSTAVTASIHTTFSFHHIDLHLRLHRIILCNDVRFMAPAFHHHTPVRITYHHQHALPPRLAHPTAGRAGTRSAQSDVGAGSEISMSQLTRRQGGRRLSVAESGGSSPQTSFKT
jgi:hypothetical protein